MPATAPPCCWPATISAMQPSRSAVRGSPKANMPTTAMPAAQFLPMASRHGLIAKLDCRVLEKLLAALEAGVRAPAVAMNLSARTLADRTKEAAREVKQQVTERLEKKLQEAPWFDLVRSYSKPGESLITESIDRTIDKSVDKSMVIGGVELRAESVYAGSIFPELFFDQADIILGMNHAVQARWGFDLQQNLFEIGK